MCKEGEENGYFATDTQGTTYVNEVWPGDANYPDFGRREVRDWWGKHHKFLVDIGVDGVWNDMNEPASFRGGLPQDVVFHDEERTTNHAEMHNVYGHYMSRATFEDCRNFPISVRLLSHVQRMQEHRNMRPCGPEIIRVCGRICR